MESTHWLPDHSAKEQRAATGTWRPPAGAPHRLTRNLHLAENGTALSTLGPGGTANHRKQPGLTMWKQVSPEDKLLSTSKQADLIALWMFDGILCQYEGQFWER
ncbi:hypothetical protein SKAU_G00156450 [Synaphobranchus kaupii]|uniref:Uncharacterized protein n=1 Tax=Synaphobranchus kaupii TaxID=118154 RepID=A0A9Q1FI75_SYNKA|nr:hypothetical protein SKAU_G00156450 [Synaphobranchus kaupii]